MLEMNSYGQEEPLTYYSIHDMIAIKAAIWLSGVAGLFVLLRDLRPVPP